MNIVSTVFPVENILNPPILFFFLGMAAVFVKSDLEIPHPVSGFLSLYLLFSIGFKGGVELRDSGFNINAFFVLTSSILMASIIPVYTFFILKRRIQVHNAAAISATYGSISAVTFITASSYLQKLGIDFGGYMVAAMALMESPAVIISVLLYRLSSPVKDKKLSTLALLKSTLTNGSVFLLLGSLFIGFVTGKSGVASLKPFYETIFTGMLSLFLLDMGLVAAKRLNEVKKAGIFLLLFALLIPLINALTGILLAKLMGFSMGDALLFTVLCAGASYIAVPAAMRISIPEANPGLYVPMALAITFPFNIVMLPFYLFIIHALQDAL